MKKTSFVQKLKMWFNNKSLRVKIEVLFLIIAVAVSVISGVITYITTYNMLSERYSFEAEVSVKQEAEDVSDEIEESYENIYRIINGASRGASRENIEQGYMGTFLSEICKANNMIFNTPMNFYAEDGALILKLRDSVDAEMFVKNKAFTDYSIYSANDTMYTDVLREDSTGRRFVRLIMRVNINTVREHVEYITYDFFTDRLRSACEKTDSSIGSASYVIDAYGDIIYCPDEELVGRHYTDVIAGDYSSGEATVNGSPSYTYISDIGKVGWQLVICLPKSVLLSKLFPVLFTVVAEILLFILFSILLIIVVRNIVTKPLNKLTSDVLSTMPPGRIKTFRPKYNDEIGMLARAFNNKNEQLVEYIENISKMEEKYLSAQFTAYTAQLNPHMLHNTMSTIIWLIESGRNDEAIVATKNISDIMRSAMGKNVGLTTVRDEVELVKKYLDIQQMRYADKFKYIMLIDEDVMIYSMPNIVLQPIVENAIYHGIKLLSSGGVIMIKGSLDENNDIVFTVTDNGPAGEDDIAAINAIIRDENVIRGIGIKNVHMRLQYNYGSQYGITYAKRNDYTAAVIKIPARLPEGK